MQSSHAAISPVAAEARDTDTQAGGPASTRGREHVLVVDDDEATCELVKVMLSRHGLEVDCCTRPEDAIQQAQERRYDAVLTDLEMDGMDGFELMDRLHAIDAEVPMVVVTGHGNLESAIRAMRVGAYDFLTKPLDTKQLTMATLRAVERSRLHREVTRLREEVDRARGFESIIGQSPSMRRVFDLVARVAGTQASVLLTGESGTGKELIARALHRRGERASGPFVAVNCAAVPPTLIESELFGHVRGAFTDARRTRPGLFLEADGGTLFLDEVGELPASVQPKLLRALQEQEVRPVGGDGTVPFDARVVCATNRDLEADVAAGRFREDLFYRINVVGIALPPLRARGNDILRLAQHFVESFAERHHKDVVGITEGAAEKLLAYDWPGNVRELENSMERAVALTRSRRVEVNDLPPHVRAFRSQRVVVDAEEPEELVPLSELEERYIRRVLRLADGNKSRAARILGIDRRTLYRKLERMESESPA